MSDEYVRLTGKAGLCLSTLGPGGLKIKNVVFFGAPYKRARTR
jgi:thiamine pyrophosphate-dependent acetolactate synthase large subunit-like protein